MEPKRTNGSNHHHHGVFKIGCWQFGLVLWKFWATPKRETNLIEMSKKKHPKSHKVLSKQSIIDHPKRYNGHKYIRAFKLQLHMLSETAMLNECEERTSLRNLTLKIADLETCELVSKACSQVRYNSISH